MNFASLMVAGMLCAPAAAPAIAMRSRSAVAQEPGGERKQVSVDGEWIFRMPSPNGEVEARLVLKTEGKRLTGTFFFGESRRLEIQDGTLEGKKFTVRRDRPEGGVMVYKMSGTVEGDQIRGTTETEMDGQPVSQEWSARRK